MGYYRRILANSSGLTIPRERLANDLIMAQLQCPSMPLEDYIIISSSGDNFQCIRKGDKDKCKIDRRLVDRNNADTFLGVDERKGLPMLIFPKPKHPDDLNVFPRSFLEQFK